MKKLVTILTIMIVLVGAVFADPEATLNITAMLTAQVPSFKMAITSDSSVTSAAAVYSDSANGPTTANSTLSTASVNSLIAESGTVTVNVSLSQVENARLTGTGASYILSVVASDLILQSNGANVASPTIFQKFTVVDSTPAITRASETLTTLVNSNPVQVATISAVDNELTVSYEGFVAASTNNPVQLGTFSASWNANESAAAGDYKATITLSISST
ncbi:MAG: hypothetical protein IJ663_02310 [Spirochaetales bacterium]|nr:hypothetical protein [Spirochaetales bacterium]